MDSALFLAILAVSVICFALRALPRIGKPLLGHDTWAILLVVDQLQAKHGYNGVSQYFLIGGEHDYPPLFFYLLSLFPSQWLRKFNWVINPGLDAINAAVLVALANFLTGDLFLSTLAGAIYSFTPVVLEESLILNTRIFGTILLNVTLATFALYKLSSNPLLISAIIIGGILILLSHKFTAEVLALLLLSFALTTWTVTPALILIAAFLGAVLFSGGFYLKVLRGQLGINLFWLKHYREYGSSYVSQAPVRPNDPGKNSKNIDRNRTNSLRKLWSRTKRVNPLFWLLRLNPFNPSALVVLLLPFVGIAEPWEWIFVQWSLLTLFFYYAATYLSFLGHYPGRTQFLDYNAFPTALLLATFFLRPFELWRTAVLIVALILAAIQNARIWARIRTLSRNDDQSLLAEIFDYLRNSTRDGVICLPASHTYAVPYFTGKRVFYTMSARNYEKFAPFFPVLKVPIKSITEQYGINFIILDENVVPIESLDLSGFRQIMEHHGYLLLEKSP